MGSMKSVLSVTNTTRRARVWQKEGKVRCVDVPLTRDGVLVTVTLTDANQEGAIFVLGSQQQLLSFPTVYVPVVPPAQRRQRMMRGGGRKIVRWMCDRMFNTMKNTSIVINGNRVTCDQINEGIYEWIKRTKEKKNMHNTQKQNVCVCVYHMHTVYHILNIAIWRSQRRR